MRIICTSKIANTTVGHIDHALAYAAGWQRLGHEVYLIEHVGRGRCTAANGEAVPFSEWDGRAHFEAVARFYGLWPRCCLIYKQGEATHGMSFAEAVDVAKMTDLLATRSGQIHRLPEIFEPPRQRAFFDGNPGSTQTLFHQRAEGHDPLDRYEFLFTMGLNIGTPRCSIPTDGLRWRPMPRPVLLSMWPAATDLRCQRFTTISTWKGRATFEWQGVRSGEKADNWLQYLDLPAASGQGLEIALRMESDDHLKDRQIFEDRGWIISDPGRLREFDDYRNYIGRSRAEFSVAHNRYVEFETGWFSDRSALYLASGKPALVQSTGVEGHLPTGKGLLTFSSMSEALAGIEAINADYQEHSLAAREIAERHFDSDRVLADILEQIGG
ncbi:MAG: hypothetical protein OEM00_01670 [Burkholderiaceae bacterium]|nr:hypothetical protein [Burkholderiaceae bacterium]